MKKIKNLNELAKGTARRLYGKFNPRGLLDDTGLNEWAEYADAGIRDQLAEGRTPSSGEALRHGNKLAAATKFRRGADGEREFLLHRGMGSDEKTHVDGGGEYNTTSSWTPHYNVALKFARDYNPDPNASPSFTPTAKVHEHVHSAWVPESKIAFVPNQHGVKGQYASEHEVVLHPFKPSLAHPDETRDLASKARYPGLPPAPPSSLKEKIRDRLQIKKPVQKSLEDRIRARFAKEIPLAKSDRLMNQEFPPGLLDHEAHKDHRWGKHHPEVYHNLDPNINLSSENADGVTQNIRFIGTSDDRHPKAVIKAPLGPKELNLDEHLADGPATSFMMSPNFRTTHREATFDRLANDVFNLGDHVPKTTVFKHPVTQEPWSAMQFIPRTERLTHPKQQLHRYENVDTLHRLAIMDSILGHNDRHGGNALIGNSNEIHLIDNANAFDYAHRFQTPTPRYSNHIQHSAVPEETHKWIQDIDENKLVDKMIASGAPTKITEMALKRLAEAKRWSRVIAANPDATTELAGLIQVIQSHRFGDQNIMSDMRSMAYNRIKRGEAFAATPSSNTDKTQIHVAAGWKRQRTR